MSPALVQALQRLLVVAVVGALSAVGLNLTLLNGALGTNAVLLIPILTAIISAALKYLGGPTISAGTASVAQADNRTGADKPPFWAA